MRSTTLLKVFFANALLSPLIFSGCHNGFKVGKDSISSTSNTTASNPWSQATALPLSDSQQSNTTNRTTASCSIYVPATLSRDQELRAVVMSQGIVQFQVSINGSAFINLGSTNGTLTWTANLFDPGIYNLRFRGLLANNTTVSCDPAQKTVNIHASTSSSAPAPTPNPPAPDIPQNDNGIIDRNYAPLVGTNGAFKGFKEIYNPSNLPKVDLDPSFAPGEKCYQLSTRHWPEVLRTWASPRYRIFIPPGTKTFFMTALTYYDSTTVQALTMKLNAPPTATYEYVLANDPSSALGRTALENLFAGAEVHGYVGLNANVMPGFPGKGTGTDNSVRYTYKTPKGGWLYINHLRIIGGVSMLMNTAACVDITDYENWYRNARWDSDGNPL